MNLIINIEEIPSGWIVSVRRRGGEITYKDFTKHIIEEAIMSVIEEFKDIEKEHKLKPQTPFNVGQGGTVNHLGAAYLGTPFNKPT